METTKVQPAEVTPEVTPEVASEVTPSEVLLDIVTELANSVTDEKMARKRRADLLIKAEEVAVKELGNFKAFFALTGVKALGMTYQSAMAIVAIAKNHIVAREYFSNPECGEAVAKFLHEQRNRFASETDYEAFIETVMTDRHNGMSVKEIIEHYSDDKSDKGGKRGKRSKRATTEVDPNNMLAVNLAKINAMTQALYPYVWADEFVPEQYTGAKKALALFDENVIEEFKLYVCLTAEKLAIAIKQYEDEHPKVAYVPAGKQVLEGVRGSYNGLTVADVQAWAGASRAARAELETAFAAKPGVDFTPYTD